MNQYISKSAIAAEIEKRETNIKEYCFHEGHDTRFDVVPEQLSQILSFLDTLEVKEVQEPTAADRGMMEEIINNLKRVEQDYYTDLTREMEWLRSKAQKGE